MINKKILMSAMSIVTALSLAGGATYAFFSDQATATGNTFSSGNADLQISKADPVTFVALGFLGTITDAFNVTGITPGYDATHKFWLKNSSTATINLSMIADILNYTAPTAPDQALLDNLLVSWRCDTDNNNSLNEAYTAEFSVKAWFDGGNATLGNIAPADEMFCEMRTRVLNTVDSSIANGTVDFDVKFDATQI